MRLPLIGGAYAARSRIAAVTRSINYFPEANPQGATIAPFTLYQAPGLVPLVTATGNANPVRQVYRASNGAGYCVIGQTVYYISPAWVLTALGQLQTPATTPVYFIDNGTEILLVDGSVTGYTIDLATNAFVPLNDPFFTGGGTCDTIDGFILWSVPGTRQFQSTLNNQILPFDDTYIASKAGYPDPLQRLVVCQRQILLIGALKSEVWYDVGGEQFPFAEIPGTYIEHGTVSPYSVATSDINVFWLSQDLRGVGYVMKFRGYFATVISNYALSLAIRKMAATVGISDAIGFTYTQDGHEFYYLVFPAGNQTWVYDSSISDPALAWHQRCWTDANGVLQRDRANCAAWLYGKNVVGDWQNGTLYALDPSTYTDTVAGTVYAKSFIRTFPHIGLGQTDSQQGEAWGFQVTWNDFIADIESGEGSGGPVVNGIPSPDQIFLRYSIDRGRSFQQAVGQSNGEPGQYHIQPKIPVSGAARDMIFEISHSINGAVAINGAWLRGQVTGQ